MTTPEREIYSFIELHRYIAKGTIRDCFPHIDIDGVLSQLESAGLVEKELRPTCHGEVWFYRHSE